MARRPKNRVQDSSPNSGLQQIAVLIALSVGIVYFFSNPKPQHYYDYTFRVAENFFRRSVGFAEKQPTWLNEFVPFEGFYYSVFPLGSVVTMIPFAFLKAVGLITEMPAAFIAALTSAVICVFLMLIGQKYETTLSRLVLMTTGILFGTWMWTNLTMGGAWQLALGFAMVGELGAIYFTVYDRRPLIAGAFFALAFGNRTEVLLTAPIFFYLLSRKAEPPASAGGKDADLNQVSAKRIIKKAKVALPRFDSDASTFEATPHAYAGGFDLYLKLALFCSVPFVLGVATLIYNFVRFHSFTDFGYDRIPGVLNEPWYNHGIFSYHYIPGQIWEMLWRPWETRSVFPYIVPNPFSSSILWSSPFLLLVLRFGARDIILKYLSWAAIVVLCIVHWMHGNSGGWQFGYRYAMVCLPWLFVILLETAPKKITPLEWVAYIFSFLANLYATWLFHWTSFLKP
ncbi:MAG: hypothetical protein ACT4O9_12785 [Blastocatellia bacterium]